MSRSGFRAALAACALAITPGCSGTLGTVGSEAPPRRAAKELPALTTEEVERIGKLVGGARQLDPKRPLNIRLLQRPDFLKELEAAGASTDDAGEAKRDEAFLVGFDFLPPPARRGELATAKELLAEQVVGFYHRERDVVYLPKVGAKSPEDAVLQKAVLAHEIQHALQSQHFALPKEFANGDQALAMLSLIEGDAMVTMAAYLGSELGAPVGRTLRRLREATERVPRDVLDGHKKKTALDRAPKLSRDLLMFPYEEGMYFASDLFRAGGFPLLNQAYANPPTTTEHILHPEKYLAGELPRPIVDLPKALGTPIAEGVLGEFGLRTLLSACGKGAEAKRAARGWAGDRWFAIPAASGFQLAGVTAWDDEREAEDFETVARGLSTCFQENEAGGLRIGKDFSVQRSGSIVTYVRSTGAANAQLQPALVALVGAQPAPAPFSQATIPPRVELPEPERGKLSNDVYRNDWLGIVGRVPKGLRARTDDDELELLVERSDRLVGGALAVSTRVSSKDLDDKTFSEIQEAFSEAVGEYGLAVERIGGGPTKTSLGNATERLMRVRGTPVELRIVLIPICAGTGSIVFIQSYADSFARNVLDGWMDSFRFAKTRSVRACDFLDPK